MEPFILQRDQHTVSRKDISKAALNVLYGLHESGYKAYLAGGCVRDLMLGRHPKDFDIATDATPQEVKRCFRRCRLIGRRFRLAHVIFGDDVIEVATFRANIPTPENNDDPEDADQNDNQENDSPPPKRSRRLPRDSHVHHETGVVLRDNVFGSPEEDARRRDFTINALFYNIADFSIIDYVDGLQDLEKRTIHAIGDPDIRYQEDPVRMIRALRFASTLDLAIEENTYEAILRQREQLAHASHARMYEEILKFFHSGAMESAFDQWCETGLLDVMFPPFASWIREQASPPQIDWLRKALQQMDKWRNSNVKADQELLYALFLSPWIRALADEFSSDQPDIPPREALLQAVQRAQAELAHRILIPRRIAFRIFDILKSQSRFPDRRSPQRIQRFLRRPYFRDALVFYKFDLLARGENQDDLLAAWANDLANAPPPDPEPFRTRRRPRQRRRRRRS